MKNMIERIFEEQIIDFPLLVEKTRYGRYRKENKNNPEYKIHEIVQATVYPGNVLIYANGFSNFTWKIIIDEEDFDFIYYKAKDKQIRVREWGGVCYAYIGYSSHTEDSLHRIISGAIKPDIPNHVNSVGLDNRRGNLQPLSSQINNQLHWSIEEKKILLLDPIKFWTEKRDFVIFSLISEIMSKPKQIQFNIFNELCKTYPNVALKVYEKLKIYLNCELPNNIVNISNEYDYPINREYLDFFHIFEFGFQRNMRLLKNNVQLKMF